MPLLPPPSPLAALTSLLPKKSCNLPKFCTEEGLSMDGIKDGNVKVTSHLYPHGVLKLLKFNVGYIMQILAKFKNLRTSKALVTQNSLCK